MVQIIFVSHGSFSEAICKSAELILGPQEDIQYFGLFPADSPDELREKIRTAIENAQKNGEVLVLTDMLSGTPFNVTASLMEEYPFEHLSGVNFAGFVEILAQRESLTAKELIQQVFTLMPKMLVDARELYKGLI